MASASVNEDTGTVSAHQYNDYRMYEGGPVTNFFSDSHTWHPTGASDIASPDTHSMRLSHGGGADPTRLRLGPPPARRCGAPAAPSGPPPRYTSRTAEACGEWTSDEPPPRPSILYARRA